MGRCTLTLLLSAVLAGCSGTSEVSEQVEERADNRAEAMEAAAESMTNALQQNLAREQAETVRQAGEERAEAIRGSRIDADALTNEQKTRLINGDQGTPAPATR
jgi:hypothetical protein